MDLGFRGKRAMIHGGSRGIGWYTARLLAEESVSVAFCARDADGVSRALEALGKDTAGNHFGGGQVAAVD
jgi:NAD(P)-dependent dehydrogenase (short-subunit alcohol dehydrogenase family)